MLPGAAWWPPKVSLEDELFGLWRGRQPALPYMGEQVLCAPGQICPAATSQGMLTVQGNGLQILLAEANTQPDGNSTPQLFFTALSLTAVWVGVYR